MKKIGTILIIVFWIVVAFAALQDDVNTEKDAYIPDIKTEMSNFFTSHSIYPQLIQTHTTAPADGVGVAPTTDQSPSYATNTWDSINITLPTSMVSRVRVDCIESFKWGYEIFVDYIDGGTNWYYSQTYNGDTDAWTTNDWQTFTIP